MSSSNRPLRILIVVAAVFAATASALGAQNIAATDIDLLEEVMPDADRFGPADGEPPVIPAYSTAADGSESLIGYVFMTSDLPPEQFGYSGPIEAVVGMALDGTLTGVRVTQYRESYRGQMGDFLRRRGFQEQYAGKYIGDPFRVWGDVDGMSRVTISVRALSRGVRDSARKVAAAYGGPGTVALPVEPIEDIVGKSWFELRRLGVVERFEVEEPGEGSAGISLAYIGSDREGEYLLGRQLYERAIRSMTRRGGADHIMLYTVDGSRLRLFLKDGWTVEQGGETVPIEPTDIVSMGLPSGGVVSGEATMVGVMLIKRELDIREPFTFHYDLAELGQHTVQYSTQDARRIAAEDAAIAAAEAEAAAAAELEAAAAAEAERAAAEAEVNEAATEPPPVAVEDVVGDGEPEASSEADEPVAPSAEASAPVDPPAEDATVEAPVVPLDFEIEQEQSGLQQLIAETRWSRVWLMLFVLGMATWAFASKSVAVRWASLAATLFLLGWYDAGFLSITHVTGAFDAGLQLYTRDLSLLLIVGFTLVTTLVWGRIFCGFLCPFGALQDFIDYIVPDRLKRPLPQQIHDKAVWLKYGILAVVVLPAIVGSQIRIYQYFEPFGTVFFLTPSILLWSIAGGFLVASAIVPRFYCRYACPLGASLGLMSLLASRRIERVEQCDHCKVCEQTCPTGAIRGPSVDFKECVRCNECEVMLLEKRGVCRHDIEVVRSRLVQLQPREEALGAD